MYDKSMQRKAAPIFDPQSTIELLQAGDKIEAVLDDKGKRQLIDRYFEVSVCDQWNGLFSVLS